MDSKFPLKERTTKFGKEIVRFCKTLKQDAINKPLINQLVRAGTSVGANYHEACGAASSKDFRNKIYIAKKEAMEVQYWLTIMSKNNNEHEDEIKRLRDESIELGKILSKIIGTINSKLNT